MTRDDWSRLFQSLTIVDNDGIELQAFDHRSGRNVVLMPRGVRSMLPSYVETTDMRSRPAMPKYAFTKQLDAPGYEGQSAAVAAMFEHEQGQVIAPPGRGKTEIALAFIATCKTKTLVVVHTNDLLTQWIERAAESVPGLSVGVIQGKRCDIGELTIATAQTLKRYIGKGGSFWRQFGCIIIDECHHSAAETWEWLLNSCPAFYRFGFTASEKRSDGRQALTTFYIGPVIYKLKFSSGVPMTVIPVKTGFKASYSAQQWTKLVRQLVNDERRNARIAEVVKVEIEAGNSVLVLSRQIKHLENIYDALSDDVKGESNAMLVTGQLARARRRELIAQLTDGRLRCILGTQLFEEGVDIPRLNRIVLAFPGTEITALQKVGRGSRKFAGKTETVIFDMLDDLVPVLGRQFMARKRWYKSVGISIGKVRKEVGNAQEKKGRQFLRNLTPARSRRA